MGILILSEAEVNVSRCIVVDAVPSINDVLLCRFASMPGGEGVQTLKVSSAVCAL